MTRPRTGVARHRRHARARLANLVMVPVGADDKVAFFNHVDSVQLVVDLVGVVTQ